MPVKKFAFDPRYFQLCFQLAFMTYGLLWLGWTAEWEHYFFTIAGALLFNYLAEGRRQKKWPDLAAWRSWGLSALVSAMSLCLLLKTGHWYTSLLAAGLTVASKYIIRVRGRHIFNPSAFGIVATLLLSKDAWLSPGQWGSDIVLFFFTTFCGFYVSKADGMLKNRTSQVIIVHDGDRNTITMYNDFKGDLKDFGTVVPVPVVLGRNDIKVVDQKMFQTLNDYSQPRLVEYYDNNPCNPIEYELRSMVPGVAVNKLSIRGAADTDKKDLGVRIEAKYLVGEYDILILSAKESQGLKTWLTQNGYKIPAGAEEVLEPYIKSNLKFFVVKVNEEEKKKLPGNFLSPIQISFESPRFMLPIRLGMANADGDQDMIVYAFSKKGRIECANYRTVPLPTGKNIPLFVQNNFSGFYSNLQEPGWARPKDRH